MDIALRPQNAIGAAILGVLALLVLMMNQAATQVQVNVQAQPRQNAKTVFTVVIADDEPLEQAKTAAAVEIVVRALGYEPRVLMPLIASQTLQFALTGNNGGQANAVFLDGGYGLAANVMDWVVPDVDGIPGLAKGNTLAAYLRVSGYTGPIILTSGFPPDYLGEPGSENFATAIKKQDFWGNPMKFLEALRNFLK